MQHIIRKIADPFKHIEVRVVDDNGNPEDHYVIAPGDDYSSRPQHIQDACVELHTPEIIAAYQAHKQAQ